MNLNISGTLNIFRLFSRPSLCLPHYTCSTFDDLPTSESAGGKIVIPIPESQQRKDASGTVQTSRIIKAVVLDKDNCFAAPHENDVYPAYKVCLCRSGIQGTGPRRTMPLDKLVASI